MLKAEDVTLHFKSSIDISYKERLDRLFFFNRNQYKFKEVVEQSIKDYAMPVLKVQGSRVAVEFEEEKVGQSLHILDSNKPDAELIGVVMYARDSEDTITIVHMVLHEECEAIMRRSHVNIALIVLEKLIPIFKKLKGVERVKMYYTGKALKI